MFHGLLPRAWRLAFREWASPAQVGPADDYAKMARSKAYRAKLFLSGVHADIKCAIYSFVVAPTENLMMVLQSLDAK